LTVVVRISDAVELVIRMPKAFTNVSPGLSQPWGDIEKCIEL